MAPPKYAALQWKHDQEVAAHPYPHAARPTRRHRHKRDHGRVVIDTDTPAAPAVQSSPTRQADEVARDAA